MAKSKGKNRPVKKQVEIMTMPEWPWNEKRTFLIFSSMLTFLTLVLFSPYLFGPNLFIFNDSGWDTLTAFYPNLVHNARYFQEEIIPGWTFYIGLGDNFYPGYLLHPFHWFMLPMGPETIAHAIGWMQAGVVILTGLVFYRFLKEAHFALPVCFIGALMYSFGGYLILGTTWYGHAHVVFWMSLCFLGFELLLRKKIWWVFPIPFIFILGVRGYFLILFMTVYGLVRMLDVYGPSILKVLQGYKRMLICGVIAILFVLPFIGGEWHRFENSPRVTGNVSYSDRLIDQPVFGISVAKHNVTAIMRCFSNDGLGTGSDFKGWRNYLEAPALYMGLLTLLLVFQFFVLADRRQKWIYGLFLLFWCFIMIFPWFRYAFYGFAGNYYKGALSLFIPFSFLYVGLLGFQQIISGKSINKWALFSSLILWLGLLWYPYDLQDVNISQVVQVKASLFLLGLSAALWIMADGLLKKWSYPLLILVVCLEGLAMSWPTINHRETLKKEDIPNKQFHFDDSMEAVRRIKERDKDAFYRIDKVYGSVKTGYNDGMVQDFFGSKSYMSHNHKNYVEFLDKMGVIDGSKEANTRWLVGLSATNLFHGLFSIKYLLSDKATQSKVDPAIYMPFDSIGQTTVNRNTYYIPFGIPMEYCITPEVHEGLSVNERRRSVYFGVVAGDQIGWRTKLKPLPVENMSFFGTAIRDRSHELSGKAMKMEYFSHNRIVGSIEVDNPTCLFFSIPYDTGWKVHVNDQKKELDMINYGFTGLYLKPGKHVIELNYEPPLSRSGWLGWIGLALGTFFLIRFKKYF